MAFNKLASYFVLAICVASAAFIIVDAIVVSAGKPSLNGDVATIAYHVIFVIAIALIELTSGKDARTKFIARRTSTLNFRLLAGERNRR